MDPERIKQRIAGRTAASDVAELFADELQSRDFAEAMIAELQRQFTEKKEASPTERHEPIARLGSITIPFGAHARKSLDDIPLEYLDWLCREQESLQKSLREYLKHPDLKHRRPHELIEE